MGTRSSIAVQHADNTISAIYCHFDGYLEGVGQGLIDNHNSFAAAEALVALGDLSTVAGNKVEAYSRDRGEDFEQVKPRKYATLAEYFQKASEIGDNGYRYIFAGEWKVWGKYDGLSSDPVPVAMAITKALSLADDE